VGQRESRHEAATIAPSSSADWAPAPYSRVQAHRRRELVPFAGVPHGDVADPVGRPGHEHDPGERAATAQQRFWGHSRGNARPGGLGGCQRRDAVKEQRVAWLPRDVHMLLDPQVGDGEHRALRLAWRLCRL
jgi:hypothetical protein